MGVHSGRWGVVNGVSTVRNWSVQDSHNAAPAIASNTGFGVARRPAIHDWSGNFSVFAPLPPAYPGEAINFIGYMAPDDNISGVGQRYFGTALISQAVLSMNWSGGENIGWGLDFGGHLELENANASAEILDSTAPSIYPIAGAYVEYSTDGVSWSTWTDVATLQLTLLCSLQTFVNSSTYVGSKLWTGRRAGNMDWNASITEHNVDRLRFQKGQQIWLRLHLNASGSYFWELKFGLIRDFTGIQVNRESGAIIQQTVNVDMNANSVDDGELGHVKRPDSVIWWPDNFLS